MSQQENQERSSWWPPNRGLRRLYDWTLHWADTPYGSPALAILAFVESSFFPVPPDLLLIALSTGRPKRAFFYAGLATVFSVLGGLLGYYLGAALMTTVGERIVHFYHLDTQFQWVVERYQQAAFVSIFTAGLTPIPYKVFTLAAGAAKISIPVFVFASVLGRGLRFFGVATLLFFFGASVRQFIDRHFNHLAIAFTLLLVGGFFAVRYLFK